MGTWVWRSSAERPRAEIRGEPSPSAVCCDAGHTSHEEENRLVSAPEICISVSKSNTIYFQGRRSPPAPGPINIYIKPGKKYVGNSVCL